MMRKSVVVCAVLGVLSFSIVPSNAYYIKSKLSGEGISNGNEETGRMGESAFGIGENARGGHYIRKRSLLDLDSVENLGQDMTKLATVRSAAAGRRLMPNSKRQFSRPTPLRVYEGELVPDLLPSFVPKPRPVSMRRNSLDLPLTKPLSIPGILNPMVVQNQIPPLRMLKFLPVTGMTSKGMGVISTLLPPSHLLATALPKSLIRNSLETNKDVYTSSPENLRSKYSDLRTISTLPSFQSFPAATVDELLPLLLQARKMRAVLDRDDVKRFSVVQYIGKLWDKFFSLFGSSSAPPRDPLSTEGGGDITEGDDITGGDVITEENHNERGGGDDCGQLYTHVSHSNWEDRNTNDYEEHYDRAYYPKWDARSPSQVENGISPV